MSMARNNTALAVELEVGAILAPINGHAGIRAAWTLRVREIAATFQAQKFVEISVGFRNPLEEGTVLLEDAVSHTRARSKIIHTPAVRLRGELASSSCWS